MVVSAKQFHMVSSDKSGNPKRTFDWEKHNEMKQHYRNNNPDPNQEKIII